MANWSGFYIGANAGFGWGQAEFDAVNGTVFPAYNDGTAVPAGAGTLAATKKQDSAFIGGAQAGYGWQMQQWVFGVEGDISGTDLKIDATTTASPSGASRPTTVRGDYTAEFGWLGSLRAKAGIANGRFLYYVTGGLAYAETELHTQFRSTNPAGVTPLSSTGPITRDIADRIGWTAGVGAAWALTEMVSIGAEYRHTSLGEEAFNIGDTDSTLASLPDLATNVALELDQVMLKVNFRFMGP